MWVKNESKDTNCENFWKFDLLLHKMLKNVKTKKKRKTCDRWEFETECKALKTQPTHFLKISIPCVAKTLSEAHVKPKNITTAWEISCHFLYSLAGEVENFILIKTRFL